MVSLCGPFWAENTAIKAMLPPYRGPIDIPTNTGLKIRDTNLSHDITLKPNSNVTADRTWNFVFGDANRTLDISAADVTVSAFAAGVIDKTSARLMCQAMSCPYTFGVSGASVVHTGTTNETVLATIAVDAGAFGANGYVDVEGFITAITNNANAKTIRVRFGASGAGTGGTAIAAMAGASLATYGFRVRIANSNATNAQHGGLNNGSWGGAAAAINTATIDTTAATEIVITAELANSGDSLTLRNRSARLVYAA
jgi:hypothetical protein